MEGGGKAVDGAGLRRIRGRGALIAPLGPLVSGVYCGTTTVLDAGAQVLGLVSTATKEVKSDTRWCSIAKEVMAWSRVPSNSERS